MGWNRRVLHGVLVAFGLMASRAGAGENGRDRTPLRLAVVGLVHGHVEGVLWQARERDDIEIVGVWDPSRELFDKMAAKYDLDPALYHDDLGEMLDATCPEAVSVMTSTRDHLMAVEACAPRAVHVMVEKPLATTVEDARAMGRLAERHGIHVLTNYETSWYASVREAYRLTREGAWATPIRRVVFRHGHKGPREIGCSEEFLAWLCDPEENGAGALFDFGCYGADIMTWLMDGQRPASVMATTSQLKPEIYPDVDDDATIVLTYPGGEVGVVQASWAWTHDNKDMDVYTDAASLHCRKWREMSVRRPDTPAEVLELDPLAYPERDEWSMLRAIVRGDAEPDGLMSYETNLIVVEILGAARESARTGQAIRLANE